MASPLCLGLIVMLMLWPPDVLCHAAGGFLTGWKGIAIFITVAVIAGVMAITGIQANKNTFPRLSRAEAEFTSGTVQHAQHAAVPGICMIAQLGKPAHVPTLTALPPLLLPQQRNH